MELGDTPGDVGQPAGGVIDAVEGGLGAAMCMLCEGEHGIGVTGIEQPLELVEHVVHAGGPPRGALVVHEPPARSECSGDTLAPLPHLRCWHPRASRAAGGFGVHLAGRWLVRILDWLTGQREGGGDRVLAQRPVVRRGARAVPGGLALVDRQLHHVGVGAAHGGFDPVGLLAGDGHPAFALVHRAPSERPVSRLLQHPVRGEPVAYPAHDAHAPASGSQVAAVTSPAMTGSANAMTSSSTSANAAGRRSDSSCRTRHAAHLRCANSA